MKNQSTVPCCRTRLAFVFYFTATNKNSTQPGKLNSPETVWVTSPIVSVLCWLESSGKCALQSQASCCKSASAGGFQWHRNSLHQEKILSRNQEALFSLPRQRFWLQAVQRGMVELAVLVWFATETKLTQSCYLCLFIHPQQLGSSLTCFTQISHGVQEP